jgi:hypothetical protein
MRIYFSLTGEGRCSTWRAEPEHRRPFQGTTMAARSGGTDLPHDLATYVVERELGLERGFWNLVANGATFRSLGLRRTQPGRALIMASKDALDEAEVVVNGHVTAWQAGRPTPMAAALDEMQARWRALPPGEELALEWPTRRLPGERAAKESRGARRAGPGRPAPSRPRSSPGGRRAGGAR